MKMERIAIGTIMGMLCLFQSYALGQTITDVPSSVKNTRFYTDHFPVKRPGLSVNGFDNGGNDSCGFGLKQILNNLYNGSSYDDSLGLSTYKKIVTNSVSEIGNPNENGTQIDNNSQYLQCRAFVALSYYVLYKNGVTQPVPGTTKSISYSAVSTAIENLKSALLEPDNWYLATTTGEDEVHMTRSVENYARAVDLYMALENAYKYYNNITTDDFNAPELLDKSQKEQVLYNLFVAIHNLNHYLYDSIGGVGNYEAEAGNRPMKMFIAIGYGALCMPDTTYEYTFSDGSTYYSDTTVFDEYLSHVFRSAGAPTYTNNSVYYWGYQTGNGERFWAEGPYYFEFALMDVIPFWHAIRLNGLLNYDNYDIPDPFDQNNATGNNTRWMINPLDWLADLATPAGQLPPLDDSNKRSIRYAKMLQWDPVYGNAETGKKYVWIDNQVKNYGLSGDEATLLVELAIPRIQYSLGTAPSSSVSGTYQVNGNTYPQQQIVLREKEGSKSHYLLLNGEQGDAITRGEGHEQPDQLQFLYYVNDKSYLMDCGYNHTTPALNSKWNEYWWHNVMILDYNKYEKNAVGAVTYDNRGGLNSPYVSTARKVSDHRPVTDLSLTKLHNDNLVLMNGSVTLATKGANQTANYIRNILYVNDNKPYVIDLNSIHSDDGLKEYMMQYYGHGSSLWFEGPGWTSWGGGSTSDDRLFIYYGAVEFDMNNYPYPYVSNDTLSVLERDGVNGGKYSELINYIKLTSYGDNHDFNTVAFLRVDNQPPDYAPHVVNDYNYNTENPFQVWYFQRDANTIDVLAMGSDVDGYGFPLNVNFDFDVIKDGTRLTNLTLAANKSFGFTRLVNTNGVWLSNPDYEVNLSQSSDHNYASNTIISNQTFADGEPIYVGDNVTVTLEGNVSISNTTVYLGKNAYLKVSGSLTADDVVFTSFNPDDASKQYAWVELDGSSQINNCTFTGGLIGLVQQAGTNNYVRNSTFTQNKFGIRTSSGTIKLEACNINNNTYDGLEVWGANVYTDQIFTFGQTLSWKRTHITGNGQYGIDVRGPGTLDLRYTRVSENGSHEIVVRYGGWLYAGVTQPYIYDGYNRLTDNTNTGYYLMNLAYTTDGETYITNTAWAQMNYWGGGAPPAGKIYGAVQWDPYITQDSTIDHSTSAYGMNNQNIEAAINLQEAAPTNVLTMATTDQIVSDTTNGFTADELLWAKQRIMDLKEAIAKAPNDRWNIRRVQEWYHLARRYDVKNTWGERTGVDQKLEDWQEQMETWSPLSLTQSGALQTNNVTGGSASIDNKLNANIQQAKTVRLMGEASLLLSVDELLSDGKVKEALDRSNHVISKLENKDSKSILYAYQLKGWQQLGRYDSAYAALERIKAISPDAGMTSKVTDADFVSQEKWLLYLMKEHNQGVPSASAPSIAEESVQSTDSNLPKVFALDANYPNPFNPTTTIPISLPKAAHVKVEVYNVAGQLVATLTNKDYQAGRYQLRFDAHMLASGMYLVRAHLGGKVFTRKLTLIK